MRYVLAVLAVAGLMTASAQGVVLTKWTFETSVPTTAGPHAAEVGTGSAIGFHANASVVYSNPVGNASPESFSSNYWTTAGDYYQFQTSTLGYTDLSFFFDQTRSGTGPSAFEVLYSTDGTNFTQLGTYTVAQSTWSGGTPSPTSTFYFALPPALNNQPAIYLRLAVVTPVAATAGTNRIDNVTVAQGELPAPPTLTVQVNGGASPAATDITLSNTYTGIITSAPVPQYPTLGGTGGTLSDPNGGAIGSFPYTLVSNGQIVRITPTANESGWYTFKYRLTDGVSLSDEATVNVLIQGEGEVVITEIMYSPANANDDNAGFDSDWEWIEVKNLTGSPITLGTLYDAPLSTTDNINGYVVPANGTSVLMKPDRSLFSLSVFETEWNIVGQNITIQMLQAGDEGEPRLNNNPDTLLLFAQDGSLLDRVSYEVGNNGWPSFSKKASIYLQFNQLTTFANDTGSNWQRSIAGQCGAWATPQTDESPAPAVDDSDVGSPGVLPVQLCNTAPVATNATVNVVQNASPGQIIPLSATDADGDSLVYTIVALPASGTLTDPNNAEAPVGAGGTLNGFTVRYTPALGFTGLVNFTFKASDGTFESNVATVTVRVVPPISSSPVRINEVYGNNAADDTLEYYELQGPPGTSLDNMTVVEIDGDAGTTLGRINAAWSLAGQSIPADGLFVLGLDGTPNLDLSMGATANKIQNGTGTFLLVEYYAGPLSLDADLNDDGVADVALGSLVDAVGISVEEAGYKIYYDAPFLGKTPGGKAAAGVARLCDGGDTNTDADWVYVSEDLLPPSTGTGLDGFVAGSPGVSNNSLYGGSCTGGANPVLTAAVSRKTHGGAGTFDINLLAAVATEDRANGPTIIVATFDIPIQIVSGNASVSLSSGTVSSLVVAGNQLTINMSGATANTPLTVGFPGVADAGNASELSASTMCFGVQLGDVNQDRNTNIFDVVVVRNVLNTIPSAGTARSDVTADGTINVFDLVNVRNNLNTNVVACP